MPPNSPHESPPKRLNIILEGIIRIIIWTFICVLICVILVSLLTTEFDHHPPVKERMAATDISMLETSLDTFFVDIGRYPTTSEGLNALLTNPNLPNWKGPYLRKLPTDPWGENYLYQYHDKPTPTCLLSSNGPDKLPHTDDDITNGPSSP